MPERLAASDSALSVSSSRYSVTWDMLNKAIKVHVQVYVPPVSMAVINRRNALRSFEISFFSPKYLISNVFLQILSGFFACYGPRLGIVRAP